MSELQPVPITDDRTIEQIRSLGDDRWPDGRPYILRGVCCVCLAPVAEERVSTHWCLVKLESPEPCQIHELVAAPQKCTGLAHWASGAPLTNICDEGILDMLERLPGNREWLSPALADIAERQAGGR